MIILKPSGDRAYQDFLRGAKALIRQQRAKLSQSLDFDAARLTSIIKYRQKLRLIKHIQNSVLQLNCGFCLMGRQYRLTLGENEYFLDLLFYHRFLKCLVAIELKTGRFRPEYAGKMDFYLEVLNDKERAPDDNPSIGIILCAEKDRLEVKFSLKSKANPIGVATYQLYPQVPEEYQGMLPTNEDWQRLLASALPEENENE
jgi:hypothetical protein